MMHVYDFETLINCTTVTFLQPTGAYKRFVIHELWNEIRELKQFAEDLVSEQHELVGYNCLRFDSYLLWALLKTGLTDARDITKMIYELAQEIIQEERRTTRTRMPMPETDVYLIHHFDNAARATSLKWIECHLGVVNVQEMPHPHDKPVRTMAEIYEILKYNLNDCRATLSLYDHPKTQELILVRKWAADKYNDKGMLNLSNATMGEAIFRRELESKIFPLPDPYPPRDFYLKEIIFPYIKFRTPEFQKVLVQMQNFQIRAGVDSRLEITSVLDGMEYEFALGGLHAARGGKTFTNVDSIDVKSYYPNLAIQNLLHPRHLPQDVFTKTYSDLYKKRISFPPGPANSALKESLVSIFGKSNSEYSFLYDPQFTYAITINGQLLLAMLCEALTIHKAGRVIMANTDGLEIQVSDPAMFNKVRTAWENLTMLTLESAFYLKIMIRDVNNYIALKPDKKIKTKGVYEINKDFHKDPSMAIVPETVSKWFTGEIPEEDIKKYMMGASSHKFLMFARAKTGKFVGIVKSGAKIELPKTIRYFISKKGFTLARKTDKKLDRIHKGVFTCVVNDYDTGDPPLSEYPSLIDHKWYIKEIEKLMIREKIELTLF